MSFLDMVLPEGLQYGSASGSGHATIVQETASGHEVRVTRQAQGRHRLRLIKALQTSAEAKTLKAFALQCRGAFHSFKATDVSDYSTAPDGESAPDGADSIIGVGNGTMTGPFQLVKSYGAINPYVRTLTLPVPGTTLVRLDSIPTTSFTVNGQGQVTFDAVVGNSVVITAGCKFYVPVRFGLGFDQWSGMQADAFNTWSMLDLELVEVLDEVQNPERLNPNGGRNYGSVSASIRLSFNDGNLHHMSPTVAISLILPSPTGCPGGSDIFTVSCATGAAGTIQVRDDAGTAVGAVITAGQVKTVGLAISLPPSPAATWVIG